LSQRLGAPRERPTLPWTARPRGSAEAQGPCGVCLKFCADITLVARTYPHCDGRPLRIVLIVMAVAWLLFATIFTTILGGTSSRVGCGGTAQVGP
jgi:hypothetical protein